MLLRTANSSLSPDLLKFNAQRLPFLATFELTQDDRFHVKQLPFAPLK
jgi:hypothetical protein